MRSTLAIAPHEMSRGMRSESSNTLLGVFESFGVVAFTTPEH